MSSGDREGFLQKGAGGFRGENWGLTQERALQWIRDCIAGVFGFAGGWERLLYIFGRLANSRCSEHTARGNVN